VKRDSQIERLKLFIGLKKNRHHSSGLAHTPLRLPKLSTYKSLHMVNVSNQQTYDQINRFGHSNLFYILLLLPNFMENVSEFSLEKLLFRKNTCAPVQSALVFMLKYPIIKNLKKKKIV
jgi:hypothetical protein